MTSVSRPKGVLWSLLLKDGDFEVKPPALKFIRLANGQSFDSRICEVVTLDTKLSPRYPKFTKNVGDADF